MEKKEQAVQKRGWLHRMKEIWRRFAKNKPAILGLIILFIFAFMAIFADLIVPYEMAIKQNVMQKLSPPGGEYILGTDYLGRDVLARIIHGAKYSLGVSVSTTLVSMAVSLLLAAAAAYYGGIVDTIIMRTVDVFTAIPQLILGICISAALGASELNLFIALTLMSIPAGVRLPRTTLLTIVNQEYIEAAKACGTSTFRILTKHVLANGVGPIILTATNNIAAKINTTATLCYLGLGFRPPIPEWGTMLSEARQYMRVSPHLMFAPGIALIIITVGMKLLGDGLRDALDPKLKD